jgi:hypothetical protein
MNQAPFTPGILFLVMLSILCTLTSLARQSGQKLFHICQSQRFLL